MYTHVVMTALIARTSLGRSRYVSLTTFRRDGAPVSTPVWTAVDDDGRLLVWTGAGTWKVKRLRSDPRVEVAPCTVRGRESGSRVRGSATVDEDTREVVALLKRKYGWQFRSLRGFNRLDSLLRRRPPSRMVAIKIVLDPQP
jgi:uncharacterized protein